MAPLTSANAPTKSAAARSTRPRLLKILIVLLPFVSLDSLMPWIISGSSPAAEYAVLVVTHSAYVA